MNDVGGKASMHSACVNLWYPFRSSHYWNIAAIEIRWIKPRLEVGLIATLQAFIFATLSAIYIGGAVAESH